MKPDAAILSRLDAILAELRAIKVELGAHDVCVAEIAAKTVGCKVEDMFGPRMFPELVWARTLAIQLLAEVGWHREHAIRFFNRQHSCALSEARFREIIALEPLKRKQYEAAKAAIGT